MELTHTAAIQEEIVVSFHSFTMAKYITTVPQMASVRDGAPQHMILKETVNGGCATTRLVWVIFQMNSANSTCQTKRYMLINGAQLIEAMRG